LAAVAACLAASGGAASAQQFARPEAKALYDQMKGPCAEGSKTKACGVLVYVPEDCSKEKDPHTRQVYRTYDDGTVRYQTGGTQIARQKPGMLFSGMQIFGENGKPTAYIGPPVFVSWGDYQGGKKTLPVCGKDARINANDFELDRAVENFLKNDP
jgi:hypothetical protein